MTTFTQCPDSNLDYTVNWSRWLTEGDRVTESAWSVPDDLTVGAQSHTDTMTVVWLTGGVAGSDYAVRNTVTTAGGRVHCQSLLIRVR